ncbi:uncharacterized protein J3R85_003981 [Psidium guajava]|nr:uncharacterized protein J3R85_003981 [Psidium guajava]
MRIRSWTTARSPQLDSGQEEPNCPRFIAIQFKFYYHQLAITSVSHVQDSIFLPPRANPLSSSSPLLSGNSTPQTYSLLLGSPTPDLHQSQLHRPRGAHKQSLSLSRGGGGGHEIED